MIFEPTVCRLVLSGRKTQARVPVRHGEIRPPVRKGRTVAVQPGAGRKAFGRARVVDAHVEQLGEVTFRGARAEGFRTRQEFLDDWYLRHPGTSRLTPVWVVCLSAEADEPRLLTPAARPRGSERGYTDNPSLAMRDEPEALTDTQLRDLTKFRPALEVERRRLPLLEAADRVSRELDAMQVELRTGTYSQQAKRTVRLLRRQLDSLERKL